LSSKIRAKNNSRKEENEESVLVYLLNQDVREGEQNNSDRVFSAVYPI